jgi:hypothetical protein
LGAAHTSPQQRITGSQGKKVACYEEAHRDRLVNGPTLGVRFPNAKLNTLRTAAELIEHYLGRARVHGVVSVESADRIERAILVVDTIILNLDPVLILDPISGHAVIFPRSIDLENFAGRRLGGHAARACLIETLPTF